MLSSINTCLIVVYVTCLNSSVVEHLHSMQEVPGLIPGLVYFLYAYLHLLPLQHLLAAVHTALITCCRCRAAYHFFLSLVNKRLTNDFVSAPVHAGIIIMI